VDIPIDQLVDSMLGRIDTAFGDGAGLMADKLFDILGTQATPLRVRRGRIEAVHPADPGAPPRRVSGRLQSLVDLSHDGVGFWSFGILAGVRYARAQEYKLDHPFMSVVVHENLGAVTSLVSSQLS
jgi:hypothetical protein